MSEIMILTKKSKLKKKGSQRNFSGVWRQILKVKLQQGRTFPKYKAKQLLTVFCPVKKGFFAEILGAPGNWQDAPQVGADNFKRGIKSKISVDINRHWA